MPAPLDPPAPPAGYPKPLDLIVGINPGRCRQFRPAEILALLEAFQALTGVDPLADGARLDEILERLKSGSEFRAIRSGFPVESSECRKG